MAKKLSELRKGDKVYIIGDWSETIEVCDIWKDSCQQSTLDFPRYCHVNYIRNSDKCHMQSSVDGTESNSYNGGWYFTDYEEARRFLLERLKEELSKRETRMVVMSKSLVKLRENIGLLEDGKNTDRDVQPSKHFR